MATYDVSMAITRPPRFARNEQFCKLLSNACREVMVRPLDITPTRLIVKADPVGIHMLQSVLRDTLQEKGGTVHSITIARVPPHESVLATSPPNVTWRIRKLGAQGSW